MKPFEVVHIENEGSNSDEYVSEDLVNRGNRLFEDERDFGIVKASKIHWRALLFCLLAFTGGMVCGYDLVVNGASIAMPSFLFYFGEVGPTGPYLPAIWTSLWVAMGALMQSIGAFLSGFLSDRWGRKWVGFAAGATTMISTGIQYSSVSRGALLAGKMLAGLGLGVAVSVSTSYASEVAPPNLRRPVQSSLVLVTVISQGIALGVIRGFVPDIKESAFRKVFAIQWTVGGIMMIAYSILPESPAYLIMRNRLDDARKVVTKIYGAKNEPNARLACMIKIIREEKAKSKDGEGANYIECFKGTDLKRTLAAIFIFAAPNLAGAAFFAQSIYFLVIAGLPAIHSFDIGLGGFGLAAIIIVASWFTAGTIKNRNGFYFGLGCNFISMLIIGCLYYSPTKAALWTIAVLMSVMTSIMIGTLQGQGYPIAAEVSQLRLRQKTISIGMISQTSTAWLTTFIMPYIYSVDAGNLLARTGFIFVGTTVLLFIISWYLIPDTTGMNAEDLDFAYEQKIPAWRINLEAIAHRSEHQEGKLEA
ncbi:MFS general substrate transporter [Cadophora sp. DSE1049]|nr:MFS general substrate transporter [Cadophora sp. DSE1049]